MLLKALYAVAAIAYLYGGAMIWFPHDFGVKIIVTIACLLVFIQMAQAVIEDAD